MFITEALHATTLSALERGGLRRLRGALPQPAAGAALLEWPRATPIEGEPADVVARAQAYDAYLATSAVPKLLLTFEGSPTLMIGPELTAWC